MSLWQTMPMGEERRMYLLIFGVYSDQYLYNHFTSRGPIKDEAIKERKRTIHKNIPSVVNQIKFMWLD